MDDQPAWLPALLVTNEGRSSSQNIWPPLRNLWIFWRPGDKNHLELDDFLVYQTACVSQHRISTWSALGEGLRSCWMVWLMLASLQRSLLVALLLSSFSCWTRKMFFSRNSEEKKNPALKSKADPPSHLVQQPHLVWASSASDCCSSTVIPPSRSSEQWFTVNQCSHKCIEIINNKSIL